MSESIQEESNPTTVSASNGGAEDTAQNLQSFQRVHADLSATPSSQSRPNRPFKPRQFLFGLALAGGGMGLMLFVAAGALHDVGAGGAVSLPATGLCMIIGLMLLGGGFGQMAISAPKFDDTEFQRLLAGEPEAIDETTA